MDKIQKPDEVPQFLESARELLEQVDGLMRRNRKAGTQPVAPPPSSSPLPPLSIAKPPIAEQTNETEFAVDENLTLSAEIDAELAAELARSSMRLDGRSFFEEPSSLDHGRPHNEAMATPPEISGQHEATYLQEPEWAAEHYLRSDELTCYPLNVCAHVSESNSSVSETPGVVADGSTNVTQLPEVDAKALENASVPGVSSSDLLQQETVTFLSLPEVSAAPSQDSAPYITAMPIAMSSEVKGLQNGTTSPIEEPTALLEEEGLIGHTTFERFSSQGMPELSDVVEMSATAIQAPADMAADDSAFPDDLAVTGDAVFADSTAAYQETSLVADEGDERANLIGTAFSDEGDTDLLPSPPGVQKKTYESVLETLGIAAAVPYEIPDRLRREEAIVPVPFGDDAHTTEEAAPATDRAPVVSTKGAANAPDAQGVGGFEGNQRGPVKSVYGRASTLPPLRSSAAVFLDEVLSGRTLLQQRVLPSFSRSFHAEASMAGVEGDSESPSMQGAFTHRDALTDAGASGATTSSYLIDNDRRQVSSGNEAETTFTLAPLSEKAWSGSTELPTAVASQKPRAESRMKAVEELPGIRPLPQTSAAALLDKEDYYPLLTDVVTESRLPQDL